MTNLQEQLSVQTAESAQLQLQELQECREAAEQEQAAMAQRYEQLLLEFQKEATTKAEKERLYVVKQYQSRCENLLRECRDENMANLEDERAKMQAKCQETEHAALDANAENKILKVCLSSLSTKKLLLTKIRLCRPRFERSPAKSKNFRRQREGHKLQTLK